LENDAKLCPAVMLIRKMINFRHRRPPERHPRRVSRLTGFLQNLRKGLTVRRVGLAIFVLPLLFYIYREVNHDALIIEPFSVPKRFEEDGLTSEVVSNRIGDALRQIEIDAQTYMKKDNLTSLHDEGSTPDVEVPGTKLGLKTLVEVTRAILGIYPKHVSGDIVALSRAESLSTKTRLKVTVYITQGRDRSRAVSLFVNTNDIDFLAEGTAEMVLEQVNPYILARYKYDHNNVEKAVELVQRIVLDSSEDRSHVVAALNLWGVALYDKKKYDEAVAKYQKAIQLDPTNARCYYAWGLALYRQEKYGDAVAKFQKAIELAPKAPFPYVALGAVLNDEKNYEEAVTKFQKAIALDAKNAASYNNWGRALYHQKKYDEAAAKFQKTIELDPKDASTFNAWGVMLYDQKKYEEAVDMFQKAIELDPQSADAYNAWGNVFYDQNKYDEAIAKYQKTIELDPQNADAYNNWGLVLYAKKKYSEAAAKYQKAIELDSKYADAYNNWGLVLNDQKKYDEAAQKFAKARELSK
jgi:tetratricopeptide (TPR) repeat protein